MDMRGWMVGLAACLVAVLPAGCVHAPPAPAMDLAIVGATVIEPRNGTRHPHLTVLVDDGRIVAMGDMRRVAIPAGTPELDARGRFLVPGLWDMHVHALWDPVVRETFLPLFVANGITGVRDMGGTLEVLAQVRREQAAGDPPWPTIVAAGPILDGPQPVDPSVSLAIDTAAEATLHGLPVAGHIPYGITVEEATRGMRSVEHLRAETGGLCAELSTKECDAAYSALAAHSVWQTPTLVARRPRARLDDPALVEDPRLAYVPAMLRDIWLANRARRLPQAPEMAQSRRDDFARERAAAGALPSRGLRVLAGSDAGADFSIPGFGLHDELGLLVEAGLTPAQALRAATSEAADYLGRDDLGGVEAGAVADLVLLDADPLDDIGNTRRIHAVVLRSRLFDRAALDALLEGARAR